MKVNMVKTGISMAVFMLLFTVVSFADPGDPGNLGPQPGPSAIPVDGGASLLAIAGGGYAVKRLKKWKAGKRKPSGSV